VPPQPPQLDSLIKRGRDLWSQQDTARSVWQELGDYVSIHRSNITREPSEGQKQTDNLFDSAGPHYAELLAASLGGSLTSSSQKWFSLKARQEEINGIKEVRDWLEEVADRTYLAINQSNFTDEIHETYQDLVGFGTGCLYVDKGEAPRPNVFGGLRYQAIPVGEFAMAEGPDGRVHTLFRKLRMSHGALLEKFGAEALGPELLERATNRPDDPVILCHAVYPRKDAPPQRRHQLARRMPWASCYYTEQPARIIAEGGYQEFPFAVPRWAKTAGEIYGRGPAHTALPDIRTLNEAKRLYFEAAALALAPPILELEDSVIGTLSLEPAARNVEREKDSVRPLVLGERFDVAEALKRDLNQAIAELFFIPQLHLKDSPAMTATEVVQRQEEMQRLLGPTAGRLHSELLSPTIERTIALLLRAGVLPPPPDALAQVDVDIDITYEGPLARAQKAVDLVAIERTMAWVGSVAGLKPEVLDLYDFDAMGEHVAEVAGMPSNLVRGMDQVEQMRAARAQQQAKVAQLQALAGVAEAAGKAAPMARVLSDAAGSQAGVAA